jgi:hypothetical protein
MKEYSHLFEDYEKVRIKETSEVVTVQSYWFASNKPLMGAQYNIIEYPATWFSENELEKYEELERKHMGDFEKKTGIYHPKTGVVDNAK